MQGAPLCAIMADIDHFKRINDVYGHDVGDKAIFAVAHELMSGKWHAGRLGGEEFALLLEGRRMAEAAKICGAAAGADRGAAHSGRRAGVVADLQLRRQRMAARRQH